MKAETLVHRHPPTPPNVSSEQIQAGLHHVARYNAEESHPHTLGYGSPGSVAHEGNHQDFAFQSGQLEGDHYQDPHAPEFGLGIQYVR